MPRPPLKNAAPDHRHRMFLVFTALFPLLLLGLLELSLRVLHYGPDLSLFVEARVNGDRYLFMNPDVSRRYFLQTDFQPGASPDVFLAEKPPRTVRVFCLGASTTVGYPYWYNAAFSSFLRDRLCTVFPDRRIEVVNLGMTATNSFTVLDMMRETVDQQPDAIVVYDGHNEFYGALGIASRESLGGSRALVSASLALLRFKTFVLLRDLYAGITKLFGERPAGEDRATMMERMGRGRLVPFNSAAYGEGLESFRENLAASAALCRRSGIPLLLCTQVSNLRDLLPFASLHLADLPANRLAAFDRQMRMGDSLSERHAIAPAADAYRAAVRLDSSYALTRFRLATMLDSLGRQGEAAAEYGRARDMDPVRFRASADLNSLIRQTPPPAIPVDIEEWFAARSPGGVAGATLLMEHVHPSAYGQFQIACAVAAAMRAHGVLASPEEWERHDTLGANGLWRRNLVTPLDERIARRKTEILTSGWPFRPASVPVSPVAPGDTLGQIAEMVTRGRWNWYLAHEASLAYFQGRKEDDLTGKEHEAIVGESPLDAGPRLRYAKFLLERGRVEEMRIQLLASLRVRPTILAYRALGDVALKAGHPAEAVGFYLGMRGFPQSVPELLENGMLLGTAFLQAGMRDSAAAQLQRLLELRPGYGPAASLLRRIQGH